MDSIRPKEVQLGERQTMLAWSMSQRSTLMCAPICLSPTRPPNPMRTQGPRRSPANDHTEAASTTQCRPHRPTNQGVIGKQQLSARLLSQPYYYRSSCNLHIETSKITTLKWHPSSYVRPLTSIMMQLRRTVHHPTHHACKVGIEEKMRHKRDKGNE